MYINIYAAVQVKTCWELYQYTVHTIDTKAAIKFTKAPY